MTMAALLASALLWPVVASSPFIILFAAIAFCSWYGGFGPGLFATLCGVLGIAYLFIPPPYAFKLQPLDVLRLVIFVFTALLISTLSEARRRAERAARAQRDQFYVTLASIGDAVIATDATGRVTFLNGVATQLTGWPLEEARGRPLDAIFSIINATTRLPVASPLARVLHEGVTVGLANHTLLVGRDGVARPIDDSGAPILDQDGVIVGAVLVFRDISAREEAEQARAELLAREQTARARAAFLAEASRLLAISLDYQATLRQVADLAVPALADWCIVDLVDETGALQMVASSHVDPSKTRWAYQLRADYPVDPAAPAGAPYVVRTGEPQIFPAIPDSLLEAVARNPEELAILRAVGYRSVMVVPLRARGRILGAFSLVIAESDRRFGDEDLAFLQEVADRAAVAIDNATLYAAERKARDEAEEAIRVRDLFLSVASHELKTPLTSLLLQVQFLQRRVGRAELLAERDQRALQLVVEQALRLNRMIMALLDISRLELGQLSLNVAPLDMCALARRVVAEIQPILEAHVVTCDAREETLFVLGDELRLEQVLQNLIQNAIKYSPDGGPVMIEVTLTDDRVCVSVADRGIGLPEEAMPRLFERFYRAPNADPRQISGMGIGLSIVKEIVRLHGGTVRAERREDGGSRFTFCLPSLAGEAVAAQGPQANDNLVP